jgi:hypothetical protein
MIFKDECVLMDRECMDCGQCDICDLDDSKICDDCCKCIDTDTDFKGVYIDNIIENVADINEDSIKSIKFEEIVSEEIK